MGAGELVELGEFAVGAEHVHNLVGIHSLHALASLAAILTGIEVLGMFSKRLTYTSSECETGIGVDVDLADGALRSLAELFLGNTYGIGELATELVDDIHLFLGNRRRAVEHDGETGELLLNLGEHVECERGRNETAGLGVAGALFGFELVGTVGRTDGDGERVATRTLGEVDYLFGLGVVGYFGSHFVLNACEHTELSLNGYVELVSVVNDFLGEGDVLLVGKSGTVDHDRREAEVDTVLAELEAVTVVEVEHDFGMGTTEFLGIFNGTLSHVAEKGGIGIFASTLGNLKDDRALLFGRSLDDGLELLQVVEVECGDSISAGNCSLEHLASIHES